MSFLSFLLLLAIAYLLWRISDQVPDILFRLSEIQRDISEIRRQGETGQDAPASQDGTASGTSDSEDD